MITVSLKPDTERARSQSRGIAWIAETTIGGAARQARSYSGAAYALARMLVNADVPDQPVRATRQGIPGHIEWLSLHTMATRTISESATQPIHSTRWREFPDAD